MLKKKPIALDQFTVQISNPKNRMTVTQATVYEDGRFSVNSRLAEIIYKKAISISFTSDGRYLAIRETENEENMSFPKSGTKILKEASDFLQEKKIIFPARYDVWYNEKGKFWQGDLLENPTKSPSGKHRNAKMN